jgi:hypothetical protein
MRKLVILISLAFSAACHAQAPKDSFTIHGHKFHTSVQTVNNEIYDNTLDTFLLVYRFENGKCDTILDHVLYTSYADCNNEFWNIGSVTISNDSIILRTEFFQKTGHDPIPTEDLQIYTVDMSGQVKLIYYQVLQATEEWLDVLH